MFSSRLRSFMPSLSKRRRKELAEPQDWAKGKEESAARTFSGYAG